MVRVRYLETRRLKSGATAHYYCPPADALEAGILEPCPLGTDADFAIGKAQLYNKLLDEWRAGDKPAGYAAGSIGWLIAQYQKSSWFKGRKPKTQKGYLADLKRIENFTLKSGKKLGVYLAAAITATQADAMYAALKPAGLRTANGVMVMAGRLWVYGKRYHKKQFGIDDNPFAGMSLERPKARGVTWMMDQVDQFVTGADEMQASSMGTAALICYLFNQRITDAITMTKAGWDGEALRVKQSKTGKEVWVVAMQEFRDRMALMPQHDAVQLIVDERTGQPYTEYSFSHRAAEIREAAGIPKHLQMRDLKRTGATETRAAGATVHELQAVSGNSLETIQIYALPTAPEAASAMKKRQRYRTKMRRDSKRTSK